MRHEWWTEESTPTLYRICVYSLPCNLGHGLCVYALSPASHKRRPHDSDYLRNRIGFHTRLVDCIS